MENDRDALAAKLTSADPGTRAAAALELGAQRATERLSLLVERLTTETHAEVIAAFLKAIGLLGSARELSLLAQYIDHAEPRIRAVVIEALFGLNTPVALPLIVPFLTDPDQRVRNTAALVLQKLGPDRSLHVLQQMLASPHVWMRTAAATALGLFEAGVAVPLLEKALKDASPKVQERAAMALRRFSRKQLRAASKGISRAAVKAVLKATSQPNLRKLTRKVATLAAPPPASGREAGMMRIEAVIAARDGEALSRLVDGLGDEDRFVIARLMSAIGLLEERSFVPVLVAHLTHADARVASNAVWALAQLNDTTAREQVRPLLRSMQPRLRASAILYCASDPDADVGPPLEELIRSADVQARLSGQFCLAELEKRGWAAAKRIRENVERPPKSEPAAKPPPVNEVAKSLSPDGKGFAHTDGVTGTLVPISRRRWRAFLLIARTLATATDAAVLVVPLFSFLFVLESLAGGMPGFVTPLAFLLAATLFTLRDLPSGPGVGKRLLGLQVVSAPGASLTPRLLRQIPVLLFPWGVAELWQATLDNRGQRPTDVKHGLEVVPRGSPMLVAFFALWLALFAAVAGTYVFVTSRPLAADGLLWSLKQGFRPRPTEEPALAPTTPDLPPITPTTSVASTSISLESWKHVTMGAEIPVPRDWSIFASGSAFLELRPRPGTAATTGSIVVAMPDEVEGAPEVNAWGEESARRFNQALEREGLRLTFWTPPAGPTSLGGTPGRLYHGDVMGGQEAVVFACGRTVRPVALTARTGGEPGLAHKLSEQVIRELRPMAGPEWRTYRSPFQPWDLKVPRGWTVAREDRAGLELRPGVFADTGWIRLDLAGAKSSAQERIKQVHRPAWEQHGFEVMRTSSCTIAGAPGLALDLRARGIASARFRLVRIEVDPPCWLSEWLERDAANDPPALDALVVQRSPKLSGERHAPSE